MFKKMKMVLEFMLIAGAALLLGGCGAKIDTLVQLNEDMSGKRVVTFSMSEEEVKDLFLVELPEMNSILHENHPDEFEEPALHLEEGIYEFIYTLEFSSLEEYEQKLSSLVGREVEICMVKSDSVFAKGYSYSEDCYSYELFSWLPDLLIEKGCLDPKNKDYVLEGEYQEKLEYQGEVVDSFVTRKVAIECVDLCEINGVQVFTDVDGEKLSRRFVVDIPNESIMKKEAEIVAYMQQRVPEGARLEISEGNQDNQFYTILLEDLSQEEMSQAMKVILDSEEAQFTFGEVEAQIPYQAKVMLQENLDLTAYATSNPQFVLSNYYIQDDTESIEAICIQNGKEATQNVGKSLEYPDYCQISSNYIPKYTLQSILTYQYTPAEASIITTVNEDEKSQVSVGIQFLEKIPSYHKKMLRNYFLMKNLEKLEVIWSEEYDDVLALQIEGKNRQVDEVMNQLISDYSFQFEKEMLKIKPHHTYEVEWKADFSALLGEKFDGFLHCRMVFPGEKIEVKSDGQRLDCMKENSNIFYFTSQSPVVDVKAEGVLKNPMAYVMIIIGLLILLGMDLIWIRYKIKKQARK